MSVDQDGWAEHRLLVLSLLERHEDALKEVDDRYHRQREECIAQIASLKEDLAKNVRDQFVSLKKIQGGLISKAKDEIIVDLKVPTDVQVAKITSRWEFWGLAFSSVTSLVIAVIALLK